MGAPEENRSSEPILVCRGFPSSLALVIIFVAFAGGFVAPVFVIGLWQGNEKLLPDAFVALLKFVTHLDPIVVLAMLTFTAFAAAFVAAQWIEPRSGRIEIGERGITGPWKHGKRELPWRDILRFDDGSSAYVAIVHRWGITEATLCIPTLREEERRALLELLAKRGVPRV